MSVDVDQSLGTLVGLRNNLLLKQNQADDRVVIILEGPVLYEGSENHVGVNIA